MRTKIQPSAILKSRLLTLMILRIREREGRQGIRKTREEGNKKLRTKKTRQDWDGGLAPSAVLLLLLRTDS